ncbi:MAG: type II toxin-antitoxin system death-on-curing family toxin [Propionibacteriales bacterium]|nr:type II toxin-antitoxin system death-on-curing family toxin [Propionibacteriales bacterium]
MTTYLTLEDLLQLVSDLGVGPIRDLGLLDSAAHRPTTSLYGHDAYPGLDDKAAVLLESLVRNHPLVDGNKRIGWLAVVVFYGLNGVDLDAPDDDAFDLVVGMAAGEVEFGAAAARLRSWRDGSG